MPQQERERAERQVPQQERELQQVSPQVVLQEQERAVPRVWALQQVWLQARERAERRELQARERAERRELQVQEREQEPPVWAVRASGRAAVAAACRRRRSGATCRR